MKKIYFILPAAITITAVILFSGYKSMNDRHEAYQLKIMSARQNLQTTSVAPGKEEWAAFKSVSEAKIRENEIVIIELKSKIELSARKVDALYKKEVALLEEQLRFEKARLEAFGKSPINWDTFKPGFRKELAEIGISAKNLSANFGKAMIKTKDSKQPETYIANLSDKN